MLEEHKKMLITVKEDKMEKKNRLPLLDIFRIFICGMVFLFHAVIHKFWILSDDSIFYSNLTTGALYMDAFFILSGFLLYYLYSDKIKGLSITDLKDFYIKRFMRIYPQYFIYTLTVIICSGTLILSVLPIETLCLQGFFPMLFSKMGNGGTWFISCLMFCYLVFPFFVFLIKQLNKNILMLFFLYLAIVYFNIVMVDLKIKWVVLYVHPLYRLLEFLIGLLVAKLFLTKKHLNNILSSIFVIFCFIILFVGVSILYKSNFINHVRFGGLYPVYSIFTIPMFGLIIYLLSSVNNKFIDNICTTKFVKFISAITFPFFIWGGLAQYFTKKLLPYISIDSFLLLFLITLLLSIVAYFVIDKFIVRFIQFGVVKIRMALERESSLSS